MRGDSLRDLYAKTLALVGLGVLAGVGALFDYWPTGIRLVPAAPALALPEVAASFATPGGLPEPAEFSLADSRISVRPEPEPLLEVAAALNVVSMSEPVTAVPESVPVAFTATAPGLTVPLMTLAEHAPAELGYADSFATNDTSALAAEDPASQTSPGASWRDPVTLADAGSTADDGSFLSDALRKTRTSLVRTGARTGASIVDAVRVVGGAVRRALPNLN